MNWIAWYWAITGGIYLTIAMIIAKLMCDP